MRSLLGSLLAAVATIAFVSVASAADMPVRTPAYVPVKAPAQVAAPYSWTGCYIGANVGGAWNRQSANTDATIAIGLAQAPTSVDQNADSLIGGAHLGCNYQFAPQWLVGVEGDWSWTHLNASATAPNLFPSGAPVGTGGLAFSRDTKWLASLRGRVGWVVMPNTLLFATGGGAWAKSSYAASDAFSGGCPNCGSSSFDSTKSGYVFGGGLEYALSSNWLVRAEYLHYQFGGDSSTAFFQSAPAVKAAIFNWDNLKIDEVRVGASYKFN